MMKGVRYGTNETGEKRLLVGSQLQQMPLTFVPCERTLGSQCDLKVSKVAPLRRGGGVNGPWCSWHPGVWPGPGAWHLPQGARQTAPLTAHHKANFHRQLARVPPHSGCK